MLLVTHVPESAKVKKVLKVKEAKSFKLYKMSFQIMYVKLRLAAHLLEPAGGRVCNSFLWSRLINPSLIWSSLVHIAIIKQKR